MSSTVTIDASLLRKAALSFRAINHKLRQQILQLLHKNEKMTVTAIYKDLKLEQSVASQHLAILRLANLVIHERDGKCKYYSVNYEGLKLLSSLSENLTNNKPKKEQGKSRPALGS